MSSDCNPASNHCVTSGSYAYCGYYYCQPNSVGCNGNLLTTCKADGSDWAAGGTDCSLTGAACSGNQCKAKVCTPSALFCQSNSVRQCDYQGLTSYQSKVCGYGTYCKAQGTFADCVATPCVADSDGCLGEKYGHCSSDGMSQSTGATDCAAASQVCTAQGCTATAIDTIASANSVGAGNDTLLDFLDVRTSRKLTQIEVYLSLPAARTLTFVVFQRVSVGSQTSYELKFQKVVSATGSGLLSSGTVSYRLEADKTYAVGVNVSGGTFAFYYDSALSSPSLSFASVLGGYSYGGLTSSLSYAYPSVYQMFHQRLTTTLP
ncbi:MAG TPA: hypothetical protein VHM25_24565 [Polyangiaceae bacterium]|nr:hypothetical protein [Polyangiaceae bacterium]